MSFSITRRRSSDKKLKKSASKAVLFDISDLPVLRRKRTLAFNRIKRTYQIAEEARLDIKNVGLFLAHFSEVQNLVEKFEDAHQDILSVIDASLEEEQDSIREEFDSIYFKILAIYAELKPNSSHDESFNSAPSNVSLNVKLPRITIPSFSGDIKNWPKFYDIFNSLIHENANLSDTERMHYLVSSLSGEALGLIKTFPVQGAYYREAFKSLVSRYNSKRELAFVCWKEILNVNFKPTSPHDFRRVLDAFNENLTVLKELDLPVDHWDFVLCYLVLSKLDSKTRYEYEQANSSVELPCYKSLKEFLYSKCEALVRDNHFTASPRVLIDKPRPTVGHVKPKQTSSFVATKGDTATPQLAKPNPPMKTVIVAKSASIKCSFCGLDHTISLCPEFSKKSINERQEYAHSHNWCFNCLRPSHSLKDCKSLFRCRQCSQRHHTLLHPTVEESNKMNNVSLPSTSDSVLKVSSNRSTILLSTARVQIRDRNGLFQSFRALVDSGSQAHFITEKAIEQLGFSSIPTTRKIHGLGSSAAAVSGSIKLEIGVKGDTFFTIDALSLPSICGEMPSSRLNSASWHHLKKLPLADPDFDKPGPIDVLLGAEVFASLLIPGKLIAGSEGPSAINSIFGWLLIGNVHSDSITNSFFSMESDLHQQVQHFWELENIPTSSRLTPSEQRCEQIFVETVSRNENGRYTVALPFKDDNVHSFPGSKEKALHRFYSLEHKLHRNSALFQQYKDFMDDYLLSGHMIRVPLQELSQGKYYIPHHCVLRPDSVSTKLRVVFDASCKSDSGVSLNDTMLIGPKLQTNIMELLLRFRIHPIVFTCDMRQMYRQILVRDQDRDYQRILWRSDRNQPIQEYRLNTVTYGVSSAPFLACRTIKQLTDDEGANLPLGSKALQSDLYIDDLVTGGKRLSEVSQIKQEVIELLSRGGLELRKWASNTPELLSDLPSDHCLTDFLSLDIGKSMDIKVLGLKWDPLSDVFMFDVTPRDVKCTKRNVLSELARIFDPLGFLAPITFFAKLLVQRLWILGVDWDACPPKEIISHWQLYLNQLNSLKRLKIPRCVSSAGNKTYQIHGFADASEAGYGAVVYLRVEDDNGGVQVFLLCAKSRVAPIKKISLPRLELCAAVLLADLIAFVKQVYSSSFNLCIIFTWSDSMVVIAWLQSLASRWKTFVANRVGHIQTVLPEARWNHVPSAENPADIPSRGMLPEDLVNSSLWWAGPSWLVQSEKCWPTSDNLPVPAETHTEERVTSLVTRTEINFIDDLFEKFSSLRKIQRILGYCLRFIHNVRIKTKSQRKQSSVLSRVETHSALLIMVKHVQSQHFEKEISRLKGGLSLSKQLRKLSPFLDDQGILRVGGRLARSGLEFEHKHPAFLPRNSKLTYMIIKTLHRENCHAGVNTLQYLLVQQFWILSAKRAIRHCLSQCISCYRTNPTPVEPFMSDLPAVRVNQVKPFSMVGVDLGGPFSIKLGRHRGAKTGKAYLCLFVCLTTKALHLEVVSDLSSEAFIAALRRFVGRRGRVHTIYSDRGTNFVGAKTQLNRYITDAARSEQVEFRFNPPSSPHFGGVWESQIKVVKSHLYRIVGTQCLTFEELTTLFIQIEAMLNSRPLCPLSTDPNDLSVLTPGHFLTLEPLTAVPDENLTNVNIHRLGRWQLIQRFQQQFWERWKNEYLHTLTQRAKWTSHSQPLEVGSIVLIKTENTVPLCWPLARIVKLHPSPDGIVRVATVKTATTTLVRPLVKLCPLPSQSDQ